MGEQWCHPSSPSVTPSRLSPAPRTRREQQGTSVGLTLFIMLHNPGPTPDHPLPVACAGTPLPQGMSPDVSLMPEATAPAWARLWAGEGKTHGPAGGRSPALGCCYKRGLAQQAGGPHTQAPGCQHPRQPCGKAVTLEADGGMDEALGAQARERAGAGASLRSLPLGPTAAPRHGRAQPHTCPSTRRARRWAAACPWAGWGSLVPVPAAEGCSVRAPEPQAGVSRMPCRHLLLSRGWAPTGRAAGRAPARLSRSCRCRRTVPRCGSATGCPAPRPWRA